MEVPERLALIGGSILLSSTLIFTLKSQASNILPKVEHPISSIYDHAGDAARGSSFPSDFKDAQRNGEQTGQWGTAPFYMDDQGNMHVGSGKLQGSYSNVVNNQHIRTINLEEQIQAPQDSTNLFASDSNTLLTNISGLNKLDTSQVTNMQDMFNENPSLKSIDLSSFNTHNVTNMEGMFAENNSLNNLDISHLDMHKVTDMNYMFNDDRALSKLTLGSNTRLASNTYLPDTYYQGNQTLNLDENPHPGIWTSNN